MDKAAFVYVAVILGILLVNFFKEWGWILFFLEWWFIFIGCTAIHGIYKQHQDFVRFPQCHKEGKKSVIAETRLFYESSGSFETVVILLTSMVAGGFLFWREDYNLGVLMIGALVVSLIINRWRSYNWLWARAREGYTIE